MQPGTHTWRPKSGMLWGRQCSLLEVGGFEVLANQGAYVNGTKGMGDCLVNPRINGTRYISEWLPWMVDL